MITHRCGLHAVEALMFLHREGQAIKAEHAMARLIRDLLAEAAETGDVHRRRVRRALQVLLPVPSRRPAACPPKPLWTA